MIILSSNECCCHRLLMLLLCAEWHEINMLIFCFRFLTPRAPTEPDGFGVVCISVPTCAPNSKLTLCQGSYQSASQPAVMLFIGVISFTWWGAILFIDSWNVTLFIFIFWDCITIKNGEVWLHRSRMRVFLLYANPLLPVTKRISRPRRKKVPSNDYVNLESKLQLDVSKF